MVFVLLHHAVALKAAAFTQPLHDLHQPDLAADRGNKVPKQTCERGVAYAHEYTKPRDKEKGRYSKTFVKTENACKAVTATKGGNQTSCADEAAAVLSHEIKCTSPT